jgi:hypothetical protein
MIKMEKGNIKQLEVIKNPFTVSLRKHGVDPKVIIQATVIPEGTIHRRFQIHFIKNSEKV